MFWGLGFFVVFFQMQNASLNKSLAIGNLDFYEDYIFQVSSLRGVILPEKGEAIQWIYSESEVIGNL